MPPALRKRERVDYCEAPRAKRVKLDAPAPQPSKPNRPKQTPKKQGQAPKVATQAAPTPIPPPSQRKRQEKNNHTPIGAGEAPNRGRKRKRDAEKEIDVQQEPEAPSIPQPLTKENLRAFDEATGMAKTTSRQPTKSGIESQTKEGTSRSKKLSHQGVAEVLKKHRIFIDRSTCCDRRGYRASTYLRVCEGFLSAIYTECN